MADDVRPRVQSVFRATEILLACAQHPRGLAAKDLAELTGLSRQATYHLLHTLRQVGFLDKTPDQKFRLGLKIGALCAGLEMQLSPPAVLVPIVQDVARRTGEASSAVGWYENEPVVLSHAPGHHAVRVADVRTGQMGFAHARASGKLLLALAPPERLSAYLNTHRLEAATPNTITTRSALEAELEKVRRDGYAVDNEEYRLGVMCISMPVRLGSETYAVSVSAPADRFRVKIDEYRSVLAEELSALSLPDTAAP